MRLIIIIMTVVVAEARQGKAILLLKNKIFKLMPNWGRLLFSTMEIWTEWTLALPIFFIGFQFIYAPTKWKLKPNRWRSKKKDGRVLLSSFYVYVM